jgi:hypothetical protein
VFLIIILPPFFILFIVVVIILLLRISRVKANSKLSGLTRGGKREANARVHAKHQRAGELHEGAGGQLTLKQAKVRAGLLPVIQQRTSESKTLRWQLLHEDPDALAELRRLHQTGVDLFHADPERHAVWADATSSSMLQHWERLRADPQLLDEWRRLHQTGVDLLHANPVRHAAWLDNYMEATWRNNDWILRRTNTWYKVINEEE